VNLIEKLIHVDLSQHIYSDSSNIDWNLVSDELRTYICNEYNRGYYDAQRRLRKDLEL